MHREGMIVTEEKGRKELEVIVEDRERGKMERKGTNVKKSDDV